MKLWTRSHLITYLPTLALMILISAVLRKILIKKDEKIRMIPFRILAVVLFALEVGKQTVSLKAGYNLYHLPFHFCSLFILFIPFMAFYRGPGEKNVRAVTFVISSALFVMMLICPDVIYSESAISGIANNFINFHRVAFHNIAVFEFILILFLELYRPDTKRDIKAAGITLSLYCVIGVIMAQVLKTNFNNFYFCEADFVENARLAMIDAIGYNAAQTIYAVAASCVTILFSFLSYGICCILLIALRKIQKN